MLCQILAYVMKLYKFVVKVFIFNSWLLSWKGLPPLQNYMMNRQVEYLNKHL